MPTRSDPTSASGSPRLFLEHLRKAVAHDLRSPLGAIANYAALLESNPDPAAEEARELGHRIQRNAQRLGAMVELLARAIELAAAPPGAGATDLLGLARSELAAAGARGSIRLASPSAVVPAGLDAPALAFAWRAYFLEVGGGPEGRELEAELEVRVEHDHALLELSCAGAAARGAALEASFGLRLAEALLRARGATLHAWTEPSAGSGVRIHFPNGR